MKIILITLLLLFGNVAFSQSSEIHFSSFNFNKLILDEEILIEAGKSKIEKDNLLISFTIDSECRGQNFTIKRYGKIKSLNEFMEKFADKIIIEFLKQNPCSNPTKSQSFTIPIVVSFL